MRAISLLPFCSALLSAYLAANALRALRGKDRTVVFFFLLNIAMMFWSLFYGLDLNLSGAMVSAVAPIGSTTWIVFAFEIVGLSAAPTYWFLFSASLAGKTRWVRGWPLLLAHVPFAYGIAIATTNPLHHEFVSQTGPGAPATYGFLAIPNQIVTFALIGWGTWLLLTAIWQSGGKTSRLEMYVLAGAILMPFIGGLAWALRHAIHLPLQVNPVPILFAVLNLVLLYQVLRRGLADILPHAALQTFRTMPDAVIIVDDGLVVQAVNPESTHTFPRVKPRMPLAEAIPELTSHVDAFLADSGDFGEFELKIGDSVFWGRIRQILAWGGVPLGYSILLTNVTNLRAAEADLVLLNRELEARIEELDEANRRLAAANVAKRRFLANMSHELRTPLNSIIGFSDVMLLGLAGDISAEQTTQITMINESGKRLLALISDILDFSRIEAGKLSVSMQPVAVREMLDAVFAQVAVLAHEKGLNLIKPESADLSITTDHARVEQVLINLLTNALKFTDEGSVSLELTVEPDWIEFCVSDTGIGIPQESLIEIFQEFSRIESEDFVLRPGAGLGLSISRELATLLGGSLSATSEAGRGSSFTLRLPNR